ncbi:4342_t:CDS:2 [Ambispora gerdemannii]|uniref:4342_t:CDS:1 n=1 Tax=Ambispora gerdemannii TaxID=144530 RepID=A0A9N9G5X5_9GLOM|nr:4342_t:CDS:2 [Ambispora gerdemannii]
MDAKNSLPKAIILEVPINVPLNRILNNSEKLRRIEIATRTTLHFTKSNYNPRVIIYPGRNALTTDAQMREAKRHVEHLFATSDGMVDYIKIPKSICRSREKFIEDLLSPKLRKIEDQYKINVHPRIYKSDLYAVFVRKQNPRSVIEKAQTEVEKFLSQFIFIKPKALHSIDFSVSINNEVMPIDLFKNKFQKEICQIEDNTNIEYDLTNTEKPKIQIKELEFSSNMLAKKVEARQKILKSSGKKSTSILTGSASFEYSEIIPLQGPKQNDSYNRAASHFLEKNLEINERKSELNISSMNETENSEYNMLYNQSNTEFLAKWNRFNTQWLKSGFYAQFETLFTVNK